MTEAYTFISDFARKRFISFVILFKFRNKKEWHL